MNGEECAEIGHDPASLAAAYANFLAVEAAPALTITSIDVLRGCDKDGAPEPFDLRFAPGDIVCLVGPTGAGKSRFLAEPGRIVAQVLEAAVGMAGEPFGPHTQLSGGQSRALMIAAAAFLSPKPVVLLDEIENAGVDRITALVFFVRNEKIVLRSRPTLLCCPVGRAPARHPQRRRERRADAQRRGAARARPAP